MNTVSPIRAARKAANLTASALGKRLGVTHAAVLRWEQGRAAPRPDHAVALTQVLPTLTLESIYRREAA